MKKGLFFIYIFLNLINFCAAQNKINYAAFVDSANELKYKDWRKAESLIKQAEKKIPEADLGDFYLKTIKIYIDTNHFDEALEYCTKAYDWFTEKNDPEKLAKVNSFFAYIYAQLNDPQKALDYYRKTLVFYKSKNDKAGVIKSLNNLGNAYFALTKYDSSQHYFQKSYAIFQNYDDPVLKVFVLSNLGKLYFRKKEFAQAENYLLEAKGILDQEKISDKEANYNANYNLANFYLEQKQPEKALFYAKKTGDFVNENTVDFGNIRYYKNLYRAYQLNNDYKNSVLAFTKYDSIRELMNIEEKAVNVEKIKAQHEYELKQIKQDKRNLVYIIVLVIFFLIVIISILIAINYKNRTEALDLEKKLIEAREKELEFDNHMKEKLLVHQSMEQQKIDTIIKSTLEKVNVLKTKYQNADEISEIINELKVNSKPNTWDDFEYHFLQIHESFYKNLEQKHPNLTNYDKRLAAMLKLRLSTKEISNLMNVTPKTIENSRTRLRKKLNLTNTKEDLSKYLDEF